MKPKCESAYICVKDMERAIQFYEWFLDRPAQRKLDSFCMFDLKGFRLFLFDNTREGEAVIYGDNCLLSFQVEDAERTKRELGARGLKIVFPLKRILDNLVFEFEDPEGNHVEVYSALSEPRG